jgi:hypothetical protein
MDRTVQFEDQLVDLEDIAIEARSRAACKELSQMTEEERRMLAMSPDEKEFFLSCKAKNPKTLWSYFKEYQKKLKKECNLLSNKDPR